MATLSGARGISVPLVTSLTFKISGPPVPKARARKGRSGHWYTPTTTRNYEKLVGQYFWLATATQIGWAMDREYEVTARVYFGDLRRRDGDNVLKSILDAGNGWLWNDDHQVTKHSVEVLLDRKDPRVELTVSVREAKNG